MLNKKTLLNRTLVAIGIFAVMLGMILVDIYLPGYRQSSNAFGFISGRAINATILSVIITLSVIEMRRAIGRERIPDCFSWLLWLYAIGTGITYSMFGFVGTILLTLLVFVAAAITSLHVNRADSLIYIAFMLVYPGMFMSALLYLNRCASTTSITESNALWEYVESDIWQYLGNQSGSQLLPYNAISLAFVFAVSAATDVFAYLIGSIFGKHQLCKKISPKKTVEGAAGGVIGGLLGSFLVFVVFDWLKLFGDHFGLMFEGLGLSTASVVAIYISIGLFGSVITQIGDLLASMIKRYCGIKDFSHILGEHGGIMDRCDGIMFNAVFVSFVFMFVI